MGREGWREREERDETREGQNRGGGGEEGKGERDREKKSEERRRRRQIYIFPVARYPCREFSFLHQIVEHGGFYRMLDHTWVTLERMQFVGAD